MPLTTIVSEELKTEVLEGWTKLPLKKKDERICARGLDFKRDPRIEEAVRCYLRKIPLINTMLINYQLGSKDIDESEYVTLTAKLARLKDKLACCITEVELRDLKLVGRVYHDTVYYIDLDGGNDGAAGTATGTAWLTIEKYTSVTVRSAGDIAYVRANTSEVKSNADIVFDEDGTLISPISIIGCDSVTNDPWSDSSDVRPIIDFNDSAYGFAADSDDYWYIERLDVRQSAD